MNLHVARVRRGSTVYVYGQLVESIRREDGMPTQRVIANLGRMSEVEIRNMRLALEASRRGTQVVLDKRQLPAGTRFAKPTHNLRYLDLVVLLALWREWDLDSVLDAVLPRNAAEVAARDVITALTLQRCVDPGSKLYAEQWFPTTALPELLGIDPARFNNTRLHRVLEQLDEATPQLMQRLAHHTHERGEFVTLFLDVTDARFTGNGPEMAEKAKTKEGIVERKIGIVLLCNERGYPLRWSIIPGRRADSVAMHDVFEDIRGLDWVGDTPVVCDRAMGSSADIIKLLRTRVRFVTGLRCNEWTSYTTAIPHRCLAELAPPADDTQVGALLLEAARRVTEAGMQRVSPTLYVLDLGVIERKEAMRNSPPQGPSDIRRALMLGVQIQSDGIAGGNFVGAARRLGVGLAMSKAYRQLLKLDAELQQEILDGRADTLSLRGALKVAAIHDAAQQREMFERLRNARSISSARPSPTGELTDPPPEEESVQLRVRAAVTFNPELFVNERRRAKQQLDDIRRFVAELNEQLARPRSTRSRRDIEAAIDRVLRRRDLLEAFKVRIDEKATDGAIRYHVHVEVDLEEWRQRRAHDGFGFIVAHPDETRTAVELCQLYRAKDAVEKDFQVIKSLIRVRPIWHRTDPKVRAHVTLCMLALLLERTLNERLANVSAAQAIQVLSTCCLNRFAGTGRSHYVVTYPDDAQQALLRELGLGRFAEDDYVVERLQPR